MKLRLLTTSVASTVAVALFSSVAQAMPTNTAAGIYGEAIKGAMTARVTRGINPYGTNGSQGAFSEFYYDNTTTIDFNQAATQVGTNSYTFGPESVVYTFQNGMASQGGQTGVYSNRWAPAGANGEVNTSDYLGVFRGNSVTIDLAESLNYFGIDWGAMSAGNDFAFYDGDQLINEFTYNDVNPLAPVNAAQHGGEGNGYLHFYANESTGTFNRIVVSNSQGGGFESDNHSFQYGSGGFTGDPGNPRPVPFEMESSLGLLVVGGIVSYRKIRRSKLAMTHADFKAS